MLSYKCACLLLNVHLRMIQVGFFERWKSRLKWMSRFSCVSQVSLVLVQKPLLGLLLVVVNVMAVPTLNLLRSLLEVRDSVS